MHLPSSTSIALSLSTILLAACSGAATGSSGGAPTVDLDAKDRAWTADVGGKTLVLYTAAGNVKVSVDTHVGDATGAISCRHRGVRKSVDDGAIELELNADRTGSTDECALALYTVFRCTPSKNATKGQLVCKLTPTLVFDEVSLDDVPPSDTPAPIDAGTKK